ncbi:SAF domain-containing protein [Aquihabitans daechungensis]|uniref:SAF domain-containing protein n=1 Tax=Aquihabitans daechungensis TaxID=1052257 RepID=UPI003B9FA3A4
MGPVQPAAIRRRAARGRRVALRSRVPLHRRIRQDPAAARHWLLVAALAWVLAALVSGALHRADEARRQWGRTTPVWVAAHPLRPGERLHDAVRLRRWPAALVPAAAISDVDPGSRASTAIDTGAAITAAMVERPGGERRSVALPVPDARLPVEEGDRVDVWATADPATVADGAPATRRVAADARVVRSADASVVVEVSPGQVAAVADAAATATITLVGR